MKFISIALQCLQFQLLLLVQHSAQSTPTTDDDGSETSCPSSKSRIVESLFRFPASDLGDDFTRLLRLWYEDILHVPINSSSSSLPAIAPDPSGVHHASRSVSSSVATLFRRRCYSAPSSSHRNLYHNLERRRKEIEFRYMDDADEEMTLLHTAVKRFEPAFRWPQDDSHDVAARHKKQSTQRSSSDTIYDITPTQQKQYDTPRQQRHTTTDKRRWTWRPAGHYSSRGILSNRNFRSKFFRAMRRNQLQQHSIEWENGRLSGMFWYPPGGVREWHTNYLDLKGSITGGISSNNDGRTVKRNNNDENEKRIKSREEEIFGSQVWRMYYVRTVRDDDLDDRLQKLHNKSLSKGQNDDGVLDTTDDAVDSTDWSVNDHSAMHIIPGRDKGITLEVLRNAGARLLNAKERGRRYRDIFAQEEEEKEEDSLHYTAINTTDERTATTSTTTSSEESTSAEFDRNAIWRIPDRDGYVTLFRLPSLWHCVVSEEVHRYSLGFAFSDGEVRQLLRLAGVEFDVVEERLDDGGDCDGTGADDEL